MRRSARWIAVLAVVGIVAAACGDNGGDEPTSSATADGGDIPTGGTVRIAVSSEPASAAFDPAKEYYQLSFEILKCCLARTLYATNGKPVDEGGAELRPDIAADLPTVSEDQLTWTFPLKQGVMYSPPFEDVEVTAQDFVRAIEREADPKASAGGYSFYYSAIEGFDDFGTGDADTISGITAVDDYTLEVTVTEPTGDLGWRFAMSATTPIPPNGDARLGAAEGHTKDYGRFLVSTGPYMFEGSEAMDFSLPADKQEPVSGYTPGRSIVMVRNPSWSAETDDLRPAYADRDHDRDRWFGRRPVQQARSRRSRLRDGPAGSRTAQGLQHQPGPAGSSARLSAAGDVVHVDEPRRATVRRRAGAQGRELRVRQGGRSSARRWSVGRHQRGSHLPRRAAQQPADRLRPVRLAGRQW